MNQSIYTKIVPSIRMMASQQRVVTVRLDDRNDFLSLSGESGLRKFSFIKPEAEILTVDATTDPDQILLEVNNKFLVLYKAGLSHPDYIILKGIGVLAIAEHGCLYF